MRPREVVVMKVEARFQAMLSRCACKYFIRLSHPNSSSSEAGEMSLNGQTAALQLRKQCQGCCRESITVKAGRVG